MDSLGEANFAAAEDRGRKALENEPRAVAVLYEADTRRIVVDLIDGRLYAFPATLVQELQGATEAELADVHIDGAGLNLHWPALDADLYVPALLAGVFGTRAWMTRELARRAGQSTSLIKAAAARANGAKGGRPRKLA